MAPAARRGKPARTININGRSNGIGSGDVGMADAGGSGSGSGPERRIRSGTRDGVAGGTAGASRSKAPYATGSQRTVNLYPLVSDRLKTSNRAILPREKEAKGALDSLRTLILNRWNPEAGLLNLENLASDPAFAHSKLRAPGQKGAPRNSAPALWKLASELCPNYADLNPLSTVVGTITGSKPGLGGLRELMLIGNPLHEREMQRNAADYQSEVRRRFPSLKLLDQLPIEQTIPVPIAATPAQGLSIAGRAKRSIDEDKREDPSSQSQRRSRATLPLPMKPGFVDSETSSNAMGLFLIKFFTSFDDARSQLVYAYVPGATFSLSVNTAVSERARRMQHLTLDAIAKQKGLSWGIYLGSAYDPNQNPKNQENLSRNLVRTKNSQRRQETLHVGPEAIASFISRLPKTSHPMTDSAKFVVDSWQQHGTGEVFPDLLVIIVHGEFAEHPSMASRSFDRTFILAPSPPGSAGANMGWPCVIISDLLVLRNWTNPVVWRVEVPSPQQSVAIVPDITLQPTLSHEQQMLMAQLHSQTRLNVQFCFQCLSETGWDLQAALQAFEAAKASIPSQAFI
ncbi:MAG: nuclear mRNA export, poly(A)+RNA binding protein [Cyphobasidiales sp. Tagirdzhanova-0007]|nr:MAG: nuclear mRNA export, poly(A)+RNA binding protein [Cyphobasidiales sp. Tagirdzhanova-0007]